MKSEEVLDQRIFEKRREIWSVPHAVFRVAPIFAYTWILLNQVTLKSFASRCSLCSDL